MSLAIYVTKIEMSDPKRAAVNVVIDCDLGRMQLDLAMEPMDGDTSEILNSVRKRLEQFGQELSSVTRPQYPLRLSRPPQSK